ncbi:Fe-S protein assembly co-chaperone HscB [Pedobacter nototheniae]|uniref:Fe-S protein assembly co-chaperone HscB n=1 Tax=Pedobacter nototheniae TaxID=2488994 RepID=UPI002930D09E|nr:Fe-S protein assembly co-chaperone HscB [Pedobacter nototheniae]
MTEKRELPDYFEFYELPVQFNPDLNAVKARFYAFSKKYHPDFYANESEEKQQEVLEFSTLNNKAYQVLSNPAKRLKYVLELKGIVETDEGYQLPQSFLMEMMDVNEALMDLEFEPDANKLLEVSKEVDAIEQKLNADLLTLTSAYSENHPDAAQQLSTIKDIFYRQKYISRIRERLPK